MKDRNVTIAPLRNPQRIPFDLLTLADPSEAQVEAYLKTGTCYVAEKDALVVGVLVLNEVDPTTLEVKNIAVKTSEQGNGLGKLLLQYAEEIGRASGYAKLIIGTGNSSLAQLALYQKAGFEMDRIDKNFFSVNYPEPIYENGIQCKHLIILEKQLKV